MALTIQRNTPSILIVDDEPLARQHLKAQLTDLVSQFPCQVIAEAGDGAAALEICAQFRPDIVLLDIQMPTLNGMEVAAALTQLLYKPVLIFITAFDDFAVRAFDIDAVDYLTKPVRLERLLKALQRALERKTFDQAMHSKKTRSTESLHNESVLSVSFPSPHFLNEEVPESALNSKHHLAVFERGRLLLLPMADIIYLKAALKYVTVKTELHEYLLEESLVSLEQNYGNFFVRVHRNALVAKHAIVGFQKAAELSDDKASDFHWEVLLRGTSERLPVSRRQWSLLRSLIR